MYVVTHISYMYIHVESQDRLRLYYIIYIISKNILWPGIANPSIGSRRRQIRDARQAWTETDPKEHYHRHRF